MNTEKTCYLTRLSHTDHDDLFQGLSMSLSDMGVTPTGIYLNGNRELIFDFEYKGNITAICFQAILDLRWRRFYFLKQISAPLTFGTSSFLESPFLTEREFITEIKTLEDTSDFSKISTEKIEINEEDFRYVLSRIGA